MGKLLIKAISFFATLLPWCAFANSSVSTTLIPFPLPAHKASSLFINEQIVVIEDSSQWETSPADAKILATWKIGDSLSILPNYTWFHPFNYFLVNESNHSQVKANLSAGPSPFSPACCWIVQIDENHLFLQNGMVFCVHPKDDQILKQWGINDPVILGKEDSAWTHYPYILINVNTNDYVRVVQY